MLAIIFPLELKIIYDTNYALCSFSVFISFLLFTSHNLMQSDPLANILPLGLKFKEVISFSCPRNVMISSLDFISHSLIVLSTEPLANIVPS